MLHIAPISLALDSCCTQHLSETKCLCLSTAIASFPTTQIIQSLVSQSIKIVHAEASDIEQIYWCLKSRLLDRFCVVFITWHTNTRVNGSFLQNILNLH